MGLLDDAIREHLELKRRRGADPGEVAREQREALDSAAERKAASAGDVATDPPEAAPGDTATDSREINGDGTSTVGDLGEGRALAQTAHVATAGETAELDMSSVLDGDGDAEDLSAPPGEAGAGVGEQARASTRPVAARSNTEEDSLEWEMPVDAAEDDADEPAEDVLEETPEFLRDTPEQDRLWFEQRAPRDFDFDK